MPVIRLSPTRLAALLVTMVAACSSDGDDAPGAAANSSCTRAPWSCAAGSTCWPSDATTDVAPAFACLPSLASAQAGDPCLNTVGKPSCGDGLACYQAPGDDAGACVAFCGAGHACPAGDTCTPVGYVADAASSYSLCLPGGAGGQGGAGEQGGAGGAGSPGQAGQAGSAGVSGGSGQAGVSGSSGQAGVSGNSGQGGAGGAGQGGEAGAGGGEAAGAGGTAGSSGAQGD